MARKLSKQQLEANRLRTLAAKADAELAVQNARAVLDKVRSTTESVAGISLNLLSVNPLR
jgi:hypothetical protein